MTCLVNLDHHGDAETGPGLQDFAVNVAVPAPPRWLVAALTDALAAAAAYPDAGHATSALAGLHAVPTDCLLLTNGAAEAFTLVARARPWHRPAVIHPQFTEPEVALTHAGHEVTRVVLRQDNDFRLDRRPVPEEADLVMIGNPTNPTSRLHARDHIRRLLRPHRLVVVDEAFMDVTPGATESLVGAAGRTPGLAVIRSLTKTYGLAGIRAGYVVSTPDVVAELAGHQPHWSVNSLALAAAVACAGPYGQRHRADIAEEVARNTTHLLGTLHGLGLVTVPDPAGPFVLARHPAATELRERLRHKGFAVRRGDTFPGLGPEWIRFAARPAAAVDELAAAMRKELETLGGRR